MSQTTKGKASVTQMDDLQENTRTIDVYPPVSIPGY